MNKYLLRLMAPFVGAIAYCAQPGRAEETPSPTMAAKPTVAGWQEFVDSLRDLPSRMLAKLPPSMQNDPQMQQEIGRLALEALAGSTIDAIGGDVDYPQFLPQIGQLMNVGQPNADTIYRAARVNGAGTYRLRGQKGSLRMAVITEVGPTPGEPGAKSAQPSPHRVVHDINTLHADAQGHFDVILSATRPVGYKGDWWELGPATNRLLMRMVGDDWSKEKDLTISIERLDKPMGRPRRTAADLEQRLRGLPAATNFIAGLFVDHVDQLRRQGYVNKLKVFDAVQIGGLPGQAYYEGTYDLSDDEALIVETKLPSKCLYRSVILTNEIYETTDWYNNHSSLNDSQSKADKDGVLRVVVSAKDPGVPNWLDTAGYPTGIIQGRWAFCDEQPIPTVRKVAFADVRKSLPPETKTVTADERDREIRERRLLLQHRPLW